MALLEPRTWDTTMLLVALVVAAAAILVFGTLLTKRADRLADQTGWGEAAFGAIALGASTSLAGSVLSVSTAWQGFPELSAANAVGGIAVQTAFLVIADMTYRRANLEHAAASLENMLLGALLIVMLAAPLVARAGPGTTFLGIHPATPLLFAGYIFGLHVVRAARRGPLWRPYKTLETREDEPHEPQGKPGMKAWSAFVFLVLLVGLSGYVVAELGIGLVEKQGISQSAVGSFITAIVTSLPELVITLAAVRQGALTLAVSGIIGGNSFDVLFLAFSDIAYRDGSLFHAMGEDQAFLLAIAIVMTGVLLMGLLRRERKGVAGIGFESIGVLALYVLAAAVLLL